MAMISITRPPAPAFLSDPKEIWFKETKKAIEHYTSVPPKDKAFNFKAYNDERLKDELKKTFVKCAYCESVYGHVYDGDIEHFRPKGSVVEKNPKTPGYYWLANNWDNLLLSCQHCNQKRKHIIKANKVPLGKQDQFPLSDESTRVITHTDTHKLDLENRLLLNPCIENPEEHFDYDPIEGVMITKTDMAKKSVDVYALRRPILIDARKEALEDLFHQMSVVKRELNRLNVNQPNEYDIEFERLKRFAHKDSQYAGMARFFIRKFLKANNIID